jgi:polyisoprenoid-binding protein YceI
MLAKLASASIVLALLALAPAPAQQGAGSKADAPDGRFDVDAVHSSMVFKVKHAGIANFYGRFNKISGKLLIDADDPAESLIQLSIDAASVDTNNPDRDKHLRSPDFFNAPEHPEITFESEKVTPKGGSRFEVRGKLGLHGVEKDVTVQVEQTGFGALGGFLGTRVGYEARFTLKRSDFQMSYALDVLGDDVDVVISLEGTKS